MNGLELNEIDTTKLKSIEHVDRLVIGRRYLLETGEPRGEVNVGAFIGYLLPDGPYTKNDFQTSLPSGWDDLYPEMVFENAIVGDHYMFRAWELP